MGPYTASSCCCQAPNLPWAPVPPPHAAARPLICHGPPITASSCCCQVHSVSWVPVPPPHCCCLHRHTLPCATFRSPHTPAGFHFVIGCSMALPLLLPPPPHCGSKHWFWPRDWPNE
ncbi:unnamed protein product [Staurois parvus]|uniref:Uncharacterized protein n=1 Tax=Staurois parvus TaxID=386267 RepID=A0ABN9HAG7_9NEOB|nr:unnamed protein product [Staurois parvus]